MIELTLLLLFIAVVSLMLVVWFQRDRIRELEKALRWERSRFAVTGDQEFFFPVNISDENNEWNKMALEISRARREEVFNQKI